MKKVTEINKCVNVKLKTRMIIKIGSQSTHCWNGIEKKMNAMCVCIYIYILGVVWAVLYKPPKA